MQMLRVPLRVVFYREEDRWVAHCLEFDLLGDGDTHDEAIGRLSQAIRLQLEFSAEESNPDNLFTPAEGKYQRMFYAGSPIAVGSIQLQIDSVEIEGLEAREFKDDGELTPC